MGKNLPNVTYVPICLCAYVFQDLKIFLKNQSVGTTSKRPYLTYTGIKKILNSPQGESRPRTPRTGEEANAGASGVVNMT
jgi:hypothetical protein